MATVEYRGCKGLVYAEVTKDDSNGYTTGTVKVLAPVAEIAKTVETASESHYYDNKAAIIINTEGADTVTFTIAVPSDEVLAEITGRTYDSTTKRFIESERTTKYFAVGYILGEEGSNGSDERFVWRYKGVFKPMDETSATKNDGTDANNLSLEFSGIYTEHEFVNGKGTGVAGSAKAMAVRRSAGVCNEQQFFRAVATPDTTFADLKNLSVTATHCAVSVTRNGQPVVPGTGVIAVGDTLTMTLVPDQGYELDTWTVNGENYDGSTPITVVGNVAIVATFVAPNE